VPKTASIEIFRAYNSNMSIATAKMSRASCERARRARDARFDGRFFTAVKTTGIYCRPICPANPPLEKNVEYYDSAVIAAQAGFRPCLRCRPDSAPQSWAWLGTQTTFERAMKLINGGALQHGSITDLANRLGISTRHLRNLFQQNIGLSPKKYAVYQQCLFAKQLLHESRLPITQVAFAAGFKSVRRFNEAMLEQIGLAPRKIRASDKMVSTDLSLKMYFRPPYDWSQVHTFLSRRQIEGIEWRTEQSYSRTIRFADSYGYFTVRPEPGENYLHLDLWLNEYQYLNPVIQRIREMFDLDAAIDEIDKHLRSILGAEFNYLNGLRIPGIWNNFEAGVRAILGQQVSVPAATRLVEKFVEHLGEQVIVDDNISARLFPEPAAVVDHKLDFFRMPQSRKDTIRRFAEFMLTTADPDDIDQWSDIKGIGPWTVAYAKMRGRKDPDVWLRGDAGIKNALKKWGLKGEFESASPWRSYLCFQLWNQL